jgi:hypothetical protein
LTGTAIALEKTGARVAQEAAETQQAEVVRGRIEATVVPGVAAPHQAAARPGKTAAPLVATARPGRVVAYPVGGAMVSVAAAAVLGKAVPRAGPAAEVLAVAATDPVAVTADPGMAGATAALAVVEPLPVAPVVRAMAVVPASAGAVAKPGMTKAGLAVKAAGALCVRQRPEARV